MKRKQLFAFMLAGVLSVSSMAVPAFAEAEEIPVAEASADLTEETVEVVDTQESQESEPAVIEEEPVAPETPEETPAPTDTADPVVTPEARDSAAPDQTEIVVIEDPAVPEEEPSEDDQTVKVTATGVVSDEATLLAEIADAPENGTEITAITVSGTITLDQTITIPAGKKISILTLGTEPAILKRADGFTGALFSAESGSILTFLGDTGAKLTLDGTGAGVTGSMIQVNTGAKVSVSGNVTLTGNQSTEAEGAAITNKGGSLVLDGGTFTGNQGKYGAVYSDTDVQIGIENAGIALTAPVVFETSTAEQTDFSDTETPAEEIRDGLALDGAATVISVNAPLTEQSDITVAFADISVRENTAVVKTADSIVLADTLKEIKLDDLTGYEDYYIDEDGTLKKKEVPVTVTLAFDTQGGTAVEPKTAEPGTEVDLTDAVTTREGYEFLGWFLTTDTENGTPAGSTCVLNENTTLYAGWKRVEEGFFLYFDANGGEAVSAPYTTGKEGEEIDLTAFTATRSGYAFTGWYLTADASDESIDAIEISEDTTVYAGWIKLYTLTYETNGGTAINPVTVQDGSTVTLATPVKDGFVFAGWYTSSDLSGSAAGKTIVVDSDVTVYAKWTNASHKLTFDSNGGSSIAAQEAFEGVPFDLTSFVPTRDDYNFIGWYYTKEDAPKRADAIGDTILIDKDTTIYAGWERKPKIYDVLESTITGLDGVLKFGLRITADGKVQGDSVNFTAVGAGMEEITTPVVGDERWIPICWNMDPNKYNSYTNSSGVTVNADRRDADKNGKYTLTLNPTKTAIDSYLQAAKENPALLEDPEYFGSASNPKTKAAVYVYFRRQVYEEENGWVDMNVKYIKKPLRYYMVLEKENGSEYTNEEIQRVVSTGGGVDALANENNDTVSTGSTTADGAKTADETPVGAMSLLLAASFLTGCGVLFQKRKKEKARNKK